MDLASKLNSSVKKVHRLSRFNRVRLQQLSGVMEGRWESRDSCLNQPTLERVVELLQEDKFGEVSRESMTGQCFSKLGDQLNEDILERDIVTSDGCFVPGAFILQDGVPVVWTDTSRAKIASSAKDLREHGLSPVAIVPLSSKGFSFPRGRRLGSTAMRIRSLKALGWDVLPVPLAEWIESDDKVAFLQEQPVISSMSRDREERLEEEEVFFEGKDGDFGPKDDDFDDDARREEEEQEKDYQDEDDFDSRAGERTNEFDNYD